MFGVNSGIIQRDVNQNHCIFFSPVTALDYSLFSNCILLVNFGLDSKISW